MEILKYPEKKTWPILLKRPEIKKERLEGNVKAVIEDVKLNKDKALFKYTEQFDNCMLQELSVSEKEINSAENEIAEELKNAIQQAKQNIDIFHKSQFEKKDITETTKGVFCWRESRAVEKVGLYIPGGTAPLFSSVLMLAVPAKLAGCENIVLCSPPDKFGHIHPAILYCAKLTGITKVFKVGGAQAIAAMAYGTETIPRVYKIFGPGNQYVTKAKELVQLDGTAIDMPAGPSEVLVIADKTGNPAFVASDLLSQAEHGADSQVIFLSDDKSMINKTLIELSKQISNLPRETIARKSLAASKVILFQDMDECLEFSNLYAPEHMIIASEKADQYLESIRNAGSVFIGNYSCESAGDYASGTNHTLPTNGFAKAYSGVSIDSFVKKISFQKLTKEGIKSIGKIIEIMAEAEDLFAHKNAVSIRLKSLKNEKY